jgi:hypothetical protein
LLLRDDERGSFVVLEAILVAMLILTAILFFTSVQRPSTGADQGGIDLAQVAADTLSILKVRTIDGQSFEGWVTNATRGDTATVGNVQDFLEEILPTGARYAVRLDNGVSNLTIVSSGTSTTPHGARAAQTSLFPNWATYRNQTVGTGLTVTPGEVVATTHDLVDGTYGCFQAPNGSVTGPDGPDAGTSADTWASRWNADPGASTPWKSSTLGATEQVPFDLPFGRWKLSSTEDAGACTGGTVTYANVVPPGGRIVTASTNLAANTTLTLTDGSTFSASDVGKTVQGLNLPATARITAATDGATTATFSPKVTTAGSSGAVAISPDATFLPYGLQLVVWFGA